MNAPIGAPRTHPASATRALAAVSAAAVASALDRAALASVVESVRVDLWLTDGRLGGLVSASVLAAAALASPFAALAARHPPARVLALGLALSAAGTALSAAAWRGLALLAARVATGAGPAARAAAAPALSPGDAGWGPGGVAVVAGAAAGYALGGALSRVAGWRWALAAAAVPAVFAAVAALRAGRERPAEPARPLPVRGEGGLLAELRRLRADPPRALAVAGQGAATFAVAAMAFWTPAFLERTRGVPRAVAGLEVAAVVLMAGLGGTFVAALALERLRARTRAAERWLAAAAVLAAAPLAIAAYAAWRPRSYLVSLVLAQLLAFVALRAGAAALAAALPASSGAPAAAAALAIAVLGEAPAAAVVGVTSDLSSLGRALATLVPVALALSGVAWLWLAWRARRSPPDRGA